MSKPGTVLFSAKDGYDEDMWDDSALIQQYDRALQSSRELIRRRQSGSDKQKRDWKVGDMCRAIYSEDGVEYEGSVVFCNKANRSVTVRFFGYNNEEEVKERDLMDSLGKEEIEAQVKQAEIDMEEEEEEEGAGDDYRLGDWCRAEWSEDGVIYEAEILSVNLRKRTAEVKFVGFGNTEVKDLDELFMSKGEERRNEQMLISKEIDLKEEVKTEDIDSLLIKNCPDLLKNFGEGVELDLENLSLDDTTSKKSKKEKKEKKSKKSKDKDSEKPKRIKSEVDSSFSTLSEPMPACDPSQFNGFQIPNNQFPSRAFQSQPPSMFPSPFQGQFPNMPPLPPFMPPSPFSSMPSMPSPMFPSQPPMMPPMNSMQPPIMFPTNLPQPPPLPDSLKDNLSPELHSLLLSWYLAGYHSGVYQGMTQGKKKKSKKSSS